MLRRPARRRIVRRPLWMSQMYVVMEITTKVGKAGAVKATVTVAPYPSRHLNERAPHTALSYR